MEIQAEFEIENEDLYTSHIDQLLNKRYNKLKVENTYTENLLNQELPKEIKLEAIETKNFDTWVEYYTLYSIKKGDIKKVSKLINIITSKVLEIFKGSSDDDILIDEIDCSRDDRYYIMIFSRTFKN